MRRDRGSMLSLVLSGAAMLAWMAGHGGPVPAYAQTRGKPPPAAKPPASKGSPAADPSAPALTSDNKDLARAGYDKGRAAETAGNWQEAYTEYRAAFALYPDPAYEAAFGRAALGLAKYPEAAQTLQRMLDNPATTKSLSPGDLADVKKNLAAALLKVGRMQIEGPAGATVWIDGTLLGTLPLKEQPFIDTGERDIEARRDGTVIARVHANVTAGKTEPVTLVEGQGLAPAPTASAVATAPAPSVTAAGGTASPLGTTAPAGSGAPVGGGPPPDKGGPSWAGILALGAVAVAGAAVGTGLWITADGKGAEARRKFDELPSLPPGPCTTAECQAVHDALAAQAGLQTGAFVAWGVGAAALLGAGVVGLVTGKSAQKSGASSVRPSLPRDVRPSLPRVVPVIAGGTGGLVVQGSW
jgi:hypothetical protein